MKAIHKLVFSMLGVISAFVSSACKTFEYEADQVSISGNRVSVSNIGFKGYTLEPPAGYRLINQKDFENDPLAKVRVDLFRAGYVNSEGTTYHFHQNFVFTDGFQIIFFIPFQHKGVRKFRHTPPDILELFLIDWARKAEFSKVIRYKLDWRAESDDRGHSTSILSSREPTDGLIYEQHTTNGDLNEMFIFSGFSLPEDKEKLNQDLNAFRAGLTVHR